MTTRPVSEPWTNWDGRQTCTPAVIERPRTEAEVVQAIERAGDAGQVVRAVGAGHSFTDLCLTGGAHLDLRHLDQILDADPATGRVRVQAGIGLRALGAGLHAHGLALENQGDIDVQSLAGALATATHGTGERFGNLSSRVVGCRIALADGTVRELTAEGTPDLLRAARVSLGALGVLTEVTLEAVPGFRLRKVEEPRPLEETLDAFDQHCAAHDHFELYAFPYASTCLTYASERTDAPPAPLPAWRKWLVDDLVANRGLAAFGQAARRRPTWAPHLTRAMTAVLSRDVRTDHSHRVFATERRVRFTEMEYAIPRAHLPAALREVLALIAERRLPVAFPIEVRATAADDAFLSTAHGRATAYVAVHQFQGMPWEAYFRGVEAIMRRHEGRPHWGKRHFQSAATLAPRYPEWERFGVARAELDPHGRFTNAAIRRVLGPPPAEFSGAAHETVATHGEPAA